MTDHMLSRIPFFGKFVDERFLDYRRRSTSVAGLAAVLLAAVLFEYQLLRNHLFRWDLFSIVMLMAVIKISMMLWYRRNG